MASVEFSLGFRTGLPSRLLRKDVGYIDEYITVYAPQKLGFLTKDNNGESVPSFYIFSGTKQNIAYCKSNTNAASLINDNLLIKFDRLDLWDTTLTEADKINFISIYKQATKSGHATWFCFCRNHNNPTNTTMLTMGAHCIIGDIGLIGSGADLELPDTNIVLGQNYRIDNFKINIPYSWTY